MASVQINEDASEIISYDDPDNRFYIRNWALSRYPSYHVVSHWHKDLEFILVREGAMDYDVNGQIVHLFPGEGILVNARQLHFAFSDTHTECTYVCILFDPELLCVSRPMWEDLVEPLTRNRGVPFQKLMPESPWQKKILEDLSLAEKAKRERAASLRVASLFLDILLQLVTNIESEKSAGEENMDLVITRRMVGYVQSGLDQKLSLSGIAKSGAVGTTRCCELFRRYLGESPVQYLLSARLSRSLELLRTTDLPIQEIAASCGFDSQGYFTKTFRRANGCTPTQYRRAQRKKRT